MSEFEQPDYDKSEPVGPLENPQIDDKQIRQELKNLKIPTDEETQKKVYRTIKLAGATPWLSRENLQEMKKLAVELEATPVELMVDRFLEYIERNGRIVESTRRGDMFFAPGMLVRDSEEKLAQVTEYELIADKTRYGREDPSIRRPKKLVNPLITVRNPDGQEAKIDIDTPLYAVYARPMKAKIAENEPYSEESHLEIRGHDFQLGELASFGDQIGTLAIIYPDHQTVAISAHVIWGKESAQYLYQVNVNDIDYIERDNGDIRKNPDGTIYKPTLG